MKDFKHPHVLGLLGVCFDTPDHSPYIILPFMANGSVKTYLRAKRVHPTNFDECPVVRGLRTTIPCLTAERVIVVMLVLSALQIIWLTSISSILWVKCLASYWSIALVKTSNSNSVKKALVSTAT